MVVRSCVGNLEILRFRTLSESENLIESIEKEI